MLGLIIFSRDRPMQLQATLDSINLNAKEFFNTIDVIYVASNKDFQKGYDILVGRFPLVNLVKQNEDIVDMVLKLIKSPYICLTADDDIFYRKTKNDWIQFLGDDDVLCFSLRLGLNITYCYTLDKENKIGMYESTNDFIKWKWEEQEYDWGYPLSSISHIYRAGQLIDMSLRINKSINNLNQYESALQEFNLELQPYIVSWKQSVVFGVPANRVNITHGNNFDTKHNYTTEVLNDMYLEGDVIDIKNMDFNINAAQQEIEYKFKKWRKN